MLYAKLIKGLRFISVSLALWTMLFTPVAMGQEAKRVSAQQMQEAVDSLGLNKQITVGEFYKKNKHLMPARIQKMIEPILMANKNELMPVFEVIASKNTSGEDIPTVRVAKNGELFNIQWFGEKNKFIKFQSTTLTETDVFNFDDMMTRIVAGDEKYRKQADPKSFAKSEGPQALYPNLTVNDWKSMSNYDKANYVVNLRSLWQAARQVNSLAQNKIKTKTKKKTSYLEEQFPFFFQLFIGQDAQAAGKILTAKSCVVAGYTSEYQYDSDLKKEVCSHKMVKEAYKNDNLYKAAVSKNNCSSGFFCNPYVYGAPGGSPICLNPSEPGFQQATHFSGPCDSASRLQSQSRGEEDFLIDPKKEAGRYAKDNLKDKDLEKIFKEDHDKEKSLTENYLMGVLKLKYGDKVNTSNFDDLVLDKDMVGQIMEVKSEFEKEIAKAKDSCGKVSSEGGKVEKNYWAACDQLHRRFLFIKEALQRKCKSGPLDEKTLMCSCPAPAAAPAAAVPAAAPVVSPPPPAATPPAPAMSPAPPRAPLITIVRTVTPGASCPVPTAAVTSEPPPAATPPPPASTDVTESAKPPKCEGEEFGNVTNAPNCVCKSGSPPSIAASDDSGSGVKQYTCGGKDKPDKPSKPGDDCGFLCKVWKGVKTAFPFILAAAGAYFIYTKLAPKKPALAPAADKCPDGSIPNAGKCPQVCSPPLKLQTNGTCSCDGCPPGQSPDASCTCSSTGGGTTTTILCPDSSTRAASLDQCPDYPCWNGQKYKNPMNCPPAPSPSPSPATTTTR